MRWVVTIVAWVLATAVIVPVSFIVAIVLAGPHSSMLPAKLQVLVLILGWITVLGAPAWVARRAWRWSQPARDASPGRPAGGSR